MANYRSPGVYVEEISTLPPSVAEVASAVPAFVGYTEKADHLAPGDLLNVPFPINSFSDFETYFGKAEPEAVANIELDVDGIKDVVTKLITGYKCVIKPDYASMSKHNLHSAMRFYFANGGTRCYVVSVGKYAVDAIPDDTKLATGFDAIKALDGPTLLVCPEAIHIATIGKFTALCQNMLDQAALLQDRFAILDTYITTVPKTSNFFADDIDLTIKGIGNGSSTVALEYGAIYYPFIETVYSLGFNFDDIAIKTYTINGAAPTGTDVDLATKKMSDLKTSIFSLYKYILIQFQNYNIVLPPSAGMAGIYCGVDSRRGVWKAPANVSLTDTTKAVISITRADQDQLNINDTSGKSVNAILNSPGFGTLVMGGRTLDGNDDNWKYINVRRFFIMVEQSIKNTTGMFVFEPNTATTWAKVKAMIENYLFLKWRDGALAGAKPEQAFFVNIGLGSTMTSFDVLEGKLIVQVGMAVARPAEFIIMQFEQMLQTS
jgi:phage tail sheath protein FI